MDPRSQKKDSPLGWIIRMILMVPVVLFVTAIFLLCLPFLAAYWVFHTGRGIYLDRAYRREFASKGKPAILVYSESPHWQEYFEENILPQVGDYAVVLNWSERRKWKDKRTLPIRVYQHHRPYREFNPYALVYGPEGSPTHVPFFAAFKDNKHGKSAKLNRAVEVLANALARAVAEWTEGKAGSVGAA